MRKLQVIMSPALADLADFEGADVVVIDVLRATSSICKLLELDAKGVRPILNVEHSEQWRGRALLAGERNGKKIEGFDLGNSPSSYQTEQIKGADIVLTTTNGTKAVDIALKRGAGKIMAGAFVNLSMVSSAIRSSDKDLVIFCAGWKNRINLEDSLFAGALIYNIYSHFSFDCDAAEMCRDLYINYRTDLKGYLRKASHARRLKNFNVEDDYQYCLSIDESPVLPVLKGGVFIFDKLK